LEYWPLLTDDRMTGAQPIERQLRPPTFATAIERGDFPEAVRIIKQLCDTWGGAFMPVVPFTAGQPIDQLWAALLDAMPLDRLVSAATLDSNEIARYSALPGPASKQRLLTVLAKRPLPEVDINVLVCQVDPSDPWYLAYLAIVGDLPTDANQAQNQRDQIRSTLTYGDVVNLRRSEQPPSAVNLLSQLRSPDAWTATRLSQSELGFWPAPVDQRFPNTNRFSLDQNPIATRYGPNLAVVYEKDSVDDLALIWHLRCLHGLKPGLPLAIPIDAVAREGLEYWSANARLLWGFDGGDMAILSASVPKEELNRIADGLDINVVRPEEVLIAHRGCALVSSEIAVFDSGRASAPTFSSNDRQQLGDRLINDIGGRMSLTTVLTNHPLPISTTLRRSAYNQRGYLRGFSTGTSTTQDTATIHFPTGLEVLSALGLDHGMVATPSGPGRAAEHLMRMIGSYRDLSRITFPGVAKLLREMTRGRNTTEIRNRLSRFLKVEPGDEETDRYKILESRLDKALGSPDAEEVPYKSLTKIRNLLNIDTDPAKKWTEWAVERGILLAGFEVTCDKCLNKQWRVLRESVPTLVCNGCGQAIPKPHPIDQLTFQYRASETLLRAINSDVLPCILSLRYLSRLASGSNGLIFGCYPGVDVTRQSDGVRIGEADVALVLNDGRWIVGECKTTALGLHEGELDKLWTLAEGVDAAATFVATLDNSQECGEIWRRTDGWNGRPHFALTAEHLYDPDGLLLAGTDPFAWRTGYYQMGQPGATEAALRTAFEQYLKQLAENVDPDQRARAPWTSS
jgi:hypothetical protein